MNRFKEMREKAGLTQREVSGSLGVVQSTISMWETGESFPRAETLSALAKLYSCTTDELLSNYGEKALIGE